MSTPSETEKFMGDLQAFAHRRLNFPGEVAQILEETAKNSLDQVFADAIFHAKFATKTREILGRIGPQGEGFDKLSTEFTNSVEKTTSLLKTIIKESPQEIKNHFVDDFFGMEQASFGNLLKLLEDLSWVKNWQVDGHPLPFPGNAMMKSTVARPVVGSDRHKSLDPGGDFARIRNGAALGFVLMIVMAVVDAPVTLLGWALALLVALLLVGITIVSHLHLRKF